MGVGTNENVNENIQDFEKVENGVNTYAITENTKECQKENKFNSNAQETIETSQEKIIEPNFQIVNNENEQPTMKFNIDQTQRIDFLGDLLKESQNENLNKKNEEIVSKQDDEVKVIEKVSSQSDKFDEPKIRHSENVVQDDEKEKKHTQDKKDYRLERMLFDRINKMQGKIKESLELIKKFERINAKEENLPNIVTTLHDKLTQEVIKQFRTVGIEFNMKSYLVQAIVSDLLNKFEEGITEFKDCSENLNFVREVQEDFESRVEIASTSKVKNIFARLRGLFKPERKQERLEQLERERQEKKLEEANIHLIKYKFINNELERYTIRKNIINSLTREILHGQGSGLTLSITEFINTKVAPEMKMLGLDSLLPRLEESLFEEYEGKFDGVQKGDFLALSVGEIKKNIKFSKNGYVRSKISLVTKVEEEKRMVV